MRRVAPVVAAVAIAAFVVAACVMPGRLYPVAPPLSGVVRGPGAGEADTLVFRVVHDVSVELSTQDEVRLAADGRFAFEAPELEIAGHEYAKTYRIFLHHRPAKPAPGEDASRVVWRARYSRLAMGGPIELDCDLARPVRQGQPCQVVDPLAHPWLVSDGERIYRRLCESCHGVAGRGLEPAPAPPIPPDLTKIAARRGGRFDRVEISEWIEGRSAPEAHGPRRMPVWGERLSQEYERYRDGEALVGATLDPLVAYLESLQKTD